MSVAMSTRTRPSAKRRSECARALRDASDASSRRPRPSARMREPTTALSVPVASAPVMVTAETLRLRIARRSCSAACADSTKTIARALDFFDFFALLAAP